MHHAPTTCLNGQFLPADAAMLPITDRGFRLGDGAFETIALIHGLPYQWRAHMDRLAGGLAALRIPMPGVDWPAIAREVIARNHATDGFLRLMVTRGAGSQGYMPLMGITPNWAMEYIAPPPAPVASFTLLLSEFTRPDPSCLPSASKLAHGIGSTLALLAAREQGCDEALMLSSTGMVSEAASANLFWVRDGQYYTPSLETGCVAGTTRAALQRLLTVREIAADISALRAAEAVFLSNVRLGVWPVAGLKAHDTAWDIAHPLLIAAQRALADDRARASAGHGW